jgi:hypothetical protein
MHPLESLLMGSTVGMRCGKNTAAKVCEGGRQLVLPAVASCGSPSDLLVLLGRALPMVRWTRVLRSSFELVSQCALSLTMNLPLLLAAAALLAWLLQMTQH